MESHEQNNEANKTNPSNQKCRQHISQKQRRASCFVTHLLRIILTIVKPNVIQTKIRKILILQITSTAPYLIQQHKKLEFRIENTPRSPIRLSKTTPNSRANPPHNPHDQPNPRKEKILLSGIPRHPTGIRQSMA